MPADGHVSWNHEGRATNDAGFPTDFTITHLECDNSSRSVGLPLGSLLDLQGLMLLTGMLSDGPFRPGKAFRSGSNFDSYTEILRRLHVPYYEEARIFFFTTSVGEAWFAGGPRERMLLDSQGWQDFLAEVYEEYPAPLTGGLL